MEDKWLDKCRKCMFSYQDMETCDYKCRCTNGCHYTPYKSKEKPTSEWDRMTEKDKNDFCRHCGCDYFFHSIDQCMYDSEEFPFDTERPCLLLKQKDKHIKDSTELSGGHLW